MKLNGTELLKQFKDHGISQDSSNKRFQHTLAFQDFIGHMNKSELTEFYKGLDQNDRKTFIWSCSVCLAQDTLIDVLKSTTIHLERVALYEQFDRDIEPRENDLFKREQIFRECKKPIHKKIASLNAEISDLKNRLEWQLQCTTTERQAKERYLKRNREIETKACHFDNVRAMLALVLDETV